MNKPLANNLRSCEPARELPPSRWHSHPADFRNAGGHAGPLIRTASLAGLLGNLWHAPGYNCTGYWVLDMVRIMAERSGLSLITWIIRIGSWNYLFSCVSAAGGVPYAPPVLYNWIFYSFEFDCRHKSFMDLMDVTKSLKSLLWFYKHHKTH